MFRSVAVVIVLLLAPPLAWAQQEVRDITRLGGTTAMHKGGLKTVSELRVVANDPQFQTDVREVLSQAGLPAGLAERFIDAIRTTEYFVNSADCNSLRIDTGVIGICDSQPGQRFQWMAYRPQGKDLSLIHNVRWAGDKSFQTYVVNVEYGNTIYTLALPEPCVNLSLIGTEEIPAPPPPAVIIPPAVSITESIKAYKYVPAPVCEDDKATNKGQSLPCVYPVVAPVIKKGKSKKGWLWLVPFGFCVGNAIRTGEIFCGFGTNGEETTPPAYQPPQAPPPPAPIPPPPGSPGKPG